MSKTITISLQTLHNLYSKFLNICILHYLPSNLQNQINTLVNYKSPVDVYRHLNNLISNNSTNSNNNLTSNNITSNNITSNNLQSNNKTSNNLQSNNKTSNNSQKSVNKINYHQKTNKLTESQDNKYKAEISKSNQKRYQSREKKERISPNKRVLNILKSSQNIHDKIVQSGSHQKTLNNQVNYLINSPTIPTSKNYSNIIKAQTDKFNEIISKKTSNNSLSSPSVNAYTSNNNYQFKIKRQSETQNETIFENNKKQQTKILSPPPQIPRNEYGSNDCIKIYSRESKTQSNSNNLGGSCQILNTLTNTRPKNNLKSIIKNIQQVFRQNHKKIERYDKAYKSPQSSNSIFNKFNDIHKNAFNNISGGSLKKY